MSIEGYEGWVNTDKWYLIWIDTDMITTWYGERDKYTRQIFASDKVFDTSIDATKYAIEKTKGTTIRLDWRADFPNIDNL